MCNTNIPNKKPKKDEKKNIVSPNLYMTMSELKHYTMVLKELFTIPDELFTIPDDIVVIIVDLLVIIVRHGVLMITVPGVLGHTLMDHVCRIHIRATPIICDTYGRMEYLSPLYLIFFHAVK